ncbi:hypothetical protein JP0069_13870 [Helicobacter pylori]|nr:hypothetical protein JP0069_13870 [Helicobacter pylori]
MAGGFSEGKTSIAAAWIERLDKSMKIDHQESSDAVKIYDIDNEIELVDTLGLFGFKEKITDSGKIERYKDITKKYVSEAHLILYALNPSNPIKESHKDDLNWLFRTLNLLSRTIFVISRFDEEDYNKRFKTKKENIQNRLNDLIFLSEKEKEGLNIVAVAANPFNEGLEYWLKHKEEFQKLSHIKTLQDATQKKIKENGGKLTIIEEAKKSVIQDVVYRQMPLAKKEQQNIICGHRSGFQIQTMGRCKIGRKPKQSFTILSVLLLKHGILITNIKKSKCLKKLKKKWYPILTIKKKKF